MKRLSLISKVGTLLAAVALLPTAASATDPGWWSATGTSIWSGSPVNIENNAVVNLGQLKNVTTQATTYLNQKLAPLGAGPDIGALFPFTQDDNYAAANVGQLKNIGSKFYARLNALGFDVRPGLIANGVASSIFTSQTAPWMPWDPAAPASENAAAVNIGQLKVVFSFDLNTWASADTNSNGVPDWLETYAATLTAGMDANGDGLDDAYQLLTGSNPESTKTASSGNNATGLMVYQPLSGGL